MERQEQQQHQQHYLLTTTTSDRGVSGEIGKYKLNNSTHTDHSIRIQCGK